jgi:hypothetical protein
MVRLNILRFVVTQRVGFLVTNEISLLRCKRWSANRRKSSLSLLRGMSSLNLFL